MSKRSRQAAFGSWHSPITAELVARKSVRFGDMVIDNTDIYWVESRPTEKGRSVIVKHTLDGKARDVIEIPFSARSRVHEYGGGAFTVSRGIVYFVNFDDQRIYRKGIRGAAYAITPENGSRYADLIVDETRKRIICIQETHQGKDVVNRIVSLGIGGAGSPNVLVSGNDFYSSPSMSPNSMYLAWLTWNHPNMPWDGTELWIAEIDEAGALANARMVAGGVSESIFQPVWSPDNVLHFVSDRSGWWNIYRYIDERAEPLVEYEAEFAVPQWVFGLTTYGFIDEGLIACAFNQKGIWRLATIDINKRRMQQVETACNDITHLRTLGDWIVFYGASPTEDISLIKINVHTGAKHIIRPSMEFSLEPGYVSQPELVAFDTVDDLQAYGFFYRPQNKDYVGVENARPPLIIVTHGGPTSCSYPSFEWKIQFWTSRGFAVFDVNYGGSTGFGRTYRERLKGKWGVVDVNDCVYAAKHLIEKDLVDKEKLIIRGSSAGGYTTLAVLTFHDVFTAGASYYGVSDLESLAKETHKFESRYLDGLVGSYPEARGIYRERSPINYIKMLSAPVIFFQGLDDPVVPPNQAEKMVSALRERKIPVAYLAFEGEQHGFRKAENLKRCLEAELYFYSRVFGFELSEDIPPVGSDLEIRN